MPISELSNGNICSKNIKAVLWSPHGHTVRPLGWTVEATSSFNGVNCGGNHTVGTLGVNCGGNHTVHTLWWTVTIRQLGWTMGATTLFVHRGALWRQPHWSSTGELWGQPHCSSTGVHCCGNHTVRPLGWTVEVTTLFVNWVDCGGNHTVCPLGWTVEATWLFSDHPLWWTVEVTTPFVHWGGLWRQPYCSLIIHCGELWRQPNCLSTGVNCGGNHTVCPLGWTVAATTLFVHWGGRK